VTLLGTPPDAWEKSTARKAASGEPQRLFQVQVRRIQADAPAYHDVEGDGDAILGLIGGPLLHRMRNVAGPNQHAALLRRHHEEIGVELVFLQVLRLEIFRIPARRGKRRGTAVWRRPYVDEPA